MRVRKTVKIIGTVLGVLVALCLVAPLQIREYACTDCGSYRRQLRVLYVPVFSKTEKPDLWRYWLKHVDLNHKHQWVELERMETIGFFVPRRHVTYAAWGNYRWKIREQDLIRTLKTMPDAKSRRRLVGSLWQAGADPDSRFSKSIFAARLQGRDRADWPKILRSALSDPAPDRTHSPSPRRSGTR